MGGAAPSTPSWSMAPPMVLVTAVGSSYPAMCSCCSCVPPCLPRMTAVSMPHFSMSSPAVPGAALAGAGPPGNTRHHWPLYTFNDLELRTSPRRHQVRVPGRRGRALHASFPQINKPSSTSAQLPAPGVGAGTAAPRHCQWTWTLELLTPSLDFFSKL